MFDRAQFENDKRNNAARQARDKDLQDAALSLAVNSDHYHYVYQWTWLGLPLIQLPADIVGTQEIIWETKPDLIIETGIAWGGSIVMWASLLHLIGKGEVIGIDVALPQKNIDEIMKYPFSQERITLIHNSSIAAETLEQVRARIKPGMSVMVILDSNHTHAHVLEELRLYAPLVTSGQYLIVSDTIVDLIPPQKHRARPWGPGDNPGTALDAYLLETDRFERDGYVNDKMLMTCSPGGYLRCVR